MTQWPGKLTAAQKQLVLDGARLSWLAYSEPAQVAEWYTKSKAGDLVVDTNNPTAADVMSKVLTPPQFVTCLECDAQCYLIEYKPPITDGIDTKPVLAICVRGTSSMMDAVCDIRVNQTQMRDASDKTIPDVKIHAGFYIQFIALFSKFDKIVKRHLDDGGNLLCVGHSLASAIAAIAALNYSNTHPSQVFYAGFGTPRVGNQAFKNRFDTTVKLKWRVKNGRDPVNSCLPPLGYVHVGNELHLGPSDPYPDIPVLFDLADHDIASYVKALQLGDKNETIVPEATTTWLLRAMNVFRWSV